MVIKLIPTIEIELTTWELCETHYGNTTDQIEIKLNPLWGIELTHREIDETPTI